MDAKLIKERAAALGADLCRIAPVERFGDAPEGFRPTDIVKGCRSVIVLAARFPASTISGSSQAAYTFVRHRMIDKLDSITFRLSSELDFEGVRAIPIPSSDPYEYWDEERRHGRGILSLKHAAVLAGLGKMGKNTLLINDRLGNMLWLGAVLVDIALEPDPPADYEACIPGCTVCIDSCPAEALDGVTIDQSLCRSRMGKETEGGGWVIACNLCRVICPRCKGITK
ncbi:MAG: epoxyqueuosine reductase [Firmicutes bacterium]|nr:epoxyqueuosine reductase [Bacillota bacterium]